LKPFSFLLSAVLILTVSAGAMDLPALKRTQIDTAKSSLVVDGKPIKVKPGFFQTLTQIEKTDADYFFGKQFLERDITKSGKPYTVTLVLSQPVTAGCLLTMSTDVAVSTEAAPKADSDWTVLKVPQSQSARKFIHFDKSMSIRAIRLRGTFRYRHYPLVQVFGKRYFSLSPLAMVNAESEFTVEPDMGAPFTHKAAHITNGHGMWQNAGPEKRSGKVKRAPISDVAPAWLTMVWPVEQSISGFLLNSTIQDLRIYSYRGPSHLNPAIADKSQWKRVPHTVKRTADHRGHRIELISVKPLKTRGLKFLIRKSAHEKKAIVIVQQLSVLTDLKDSPAPKLESTSNRHPYRVAYELPNDAKLTMVINDKDGNRVRNLIARHPKSAGKGDVEWDLKKADDQYITPGTYTVSAIHHPGLKMRYRATPYPNVSTHAPQNSPWLNGHSGSGGWLADHTSPGSVTTFGDRMYMGAACAEWGIAMLECCLRRMGYRHARSQSRWSETLGTSQLHRLDRASEDDR
jgi:hypothetical protein